MSLIYWGFSTQVAFYILIELTDMTEFIYVDITITLFTNIKLLSSSTENSRYSIDNLKYD